MPLAAVVPKPMAPALPIVLVGHSQGALHLMRLLKDRVAGTPLAGRVAAAIASEIGAMRATEQVDALVTLSTDPMRYLVAPRLIAATLCLPLLAMVAEDASEDKACTDGLATYGGGLDGEEDAPAWA